MWKWWTRHPADEDGRDEDMPLLDEETDEGREGMEGMGTLVIECAWCLAEQGMTPVSGSHGICALHAQQVREAAYERRRRRVGG